MVERDISPVPVDVEVGERIRAARMMRKVSQEDLAKACGVSFQQVQKYEKGRNRVSASMLCRIAAHLDISPADFLPARTPGTQSVNWAVPLRTHEVASAAKLVGGLPRAEQRRALKLLQIVFGPGH